MITPAEQYVRVWTEILLFIKLNAGITFLIIPLMLIAFIASLNPVYRKAVLTLPLLGVLWAAGNAHYGHLLHRPAVMARELEGEKGWEAKHGAMMKDFMIQTAVLVAITIALGVFYGCFASWQLGYRLYTAFALLLFVVSIWYLADASK